MKRRQFLSMFGGAALTWPLAARSQQKAMPAIGLLLSTATPTGQQLTGVRQGLGELGFVEGSNLTFEIRSAEGVYDRLPGLVAELIARNVDVIITQAPPAARAAKAATSTIPVVFGIGTDPVAEGLIASVARPGGNLTGVTLLSADLMPKRLDLLSQLVPAARRFGLLVNPNSPAPWIGATVEAAAKNGGEIVVAKAATVAEIDTAFVALIQQGCQALLLGGDSFLSEQHEQLIALMNRGCRP
jgi:putative tryptophan/tyrosine transport system substrate-binding protein